MTNEQTPPHAGEQDNLGAEAVVSAGMDFEQGPDDEAKCPECDGDGGDKWSDYCLPCAMCGGDGRLR